MENGNGNIGASDAAVLALLADTSRAGRGGWGGEGGYGGYGRMYTNPAALQHSIEYVGRDARFHNESLREQLTNQNMLAAVGAIGTAVSGSENRVTDRLRDSELNALRETSDLARQIAACCCDTQKGLLEQALRMQECCCETQQLIRADGQQTRELINQNTIRAAVDANNITATAAAINGPAAANTAAIIAAIREGHHPHHP
jgi:hypothetical protein